MDHQHKDEDADQDRDEKKGKDTDDFSDQERNAHHFFRSVRVERIQVTVTAVESTAGPLVVDLVHAISASALIAADCVRIWEVETAIRAMETLVNRK